MADIVILGAGVSGHAAALHLSRLLPKGHTVTVVSPNSQWNWIPSNIWVGVGKMSKKDVVFPLAPVYAKKGVQFRQAKAVAIHPRGDAGSQRPAVDIVHTSPAWDGETQTPAGPGRARRCHRPSSTNSGSVDSLKVSVRCGCSPNARPIRPTVEAESPQRLAIFERVQCLALSWTDSTVATTRSSTC